MALSLMQMKALYPNDPMRLRLITKFLEGSESRVLPFLNFVDASDAFAYNYVVDDDNAVIGERSINAAYVDSNDNPTPGRETLSLFGGSIKTDNIYIDAKGDVVRLTRIDKRMKRAGKYFDKLFFNGNTRANPRQFNGLAARSIAKARVIYAGTNGGTLTQDLLDQALDAVAGENGLKKIFCSRWMRRKITQLVRSAAGGKDLSESVTQLPDYDGAQIQTVEEDDQRLPIFPFTETRGSSSLTSSIYVSRFGGEDDNDALQGIKGPSFMKLRTPVNMGEYVRDVIDNVLGIGDFSPNCFMRIAGITQT